MKLLDSIDIKGGIVNTSMVVLDIDKPLIEQSYELVEDIFHIEYIIRNNKLILDVGWYPLDLIITDESYFRVKLVENDEWGDPLFDARCNNLSELKKLIEMAIEEVETIRKKSMENGEGNL